MKFRLLFILFNFVVIAAFALVVFMPLAVLGWDYSQLFWRQNWPVAIVFLIVLGGLNTYFGVNWRLFSLLEREDWSGLIDHLEKKVIRDGRPGRQRIRALINAYVITGSAEKITDLEKHLRESDPSWIVRFPLEFGLPYILSQDADEMLAFYGEMKESSRCPEPVWVRWNYAFALLLQKKREEARSLLCSLVDEARDPVQRLLIAYLLDAASGDDEETRGSARDIRTSLRATFPPAKWEKQLERRRSGLQELVLSKLIREASDWMHRDGEEKNA